MGIRKECDIMKNIVRFLFALVVGMFVTTFASGVITVKASADNEVVMIEDEDVALSNGEPEENGSNGMFLLMGGLLIIILTVVITVVATFVVTAPIADEI